MPNAQTAAKGKAAKKTNSTKKNSSSLSKKIDLVKKHKLSKSDLLSMYTNIYTSRKLDDAEISMKKQSKAFFQISGAGHEGILTATSMVLKPKHDYFIPYYRDRALCLGLGSLRMKCYAKQTAMWETPQATDVRCRRTGAM